ncbi:174aa long hypothetical protein [Pyrococcus horikoshii OT3]|uniref:Uncharacterized protein n=1 Tax=Pyrococcus horikoshii (strain ATCC 700860 / DSM 12428 / JCM 9974 / NBRC 100139 / OT-3) TaxID=70601 RepID=O59592_PYRHO|nr:174aa long hypothetical protein [Pyrococcus horikoshii OT3]
MFPKLMNLLIPTSCLAAQSRIAAPKAPLWLMNAIGPNFGLACLSGGLKLQSNPFSKFVTPRQFGPTTLIPHFFALFTNSSSKSALPASLNPADITTTPLTPFSPHSSITSGTNFAGTAITATSTLSGTSFILLYTLNFFPFTSISPPLTLTAYIFPLKLFTRDLNIPFPTFPGT